MNRLCVSSLVAAIIASREITAGDAELTLGRRGAHVPGLVGAAEDGEVVPARLNDPCFDFAGLVPGE
jgi:hypothetical protein